MKYFSDAQQAKEFLATRIIQEAGLQGVPLSEIEQKMLYYTETGWTLPDMPDISDKFDREYDQDEYEEKIAKIVKAAADRAKKTSRDEYKQWWAAVRFLNTEDHYISLLIDEAHLRPPGDRLKLWGTGLAIVGVVLAYAVISADYDIDWSKYFPDRAAFDRFFWGTLGCLFALYVAARVLFGSRVDEWIFRVGSRAGKKSIGPGGEHQP